MYNYFYNNLVDLNKAINSRWPQSEDGVSNGYNALHSVYPESPVKTEATDIIPMPEMPCLPQDIWSEIVKHSKTDLVALACANQSLNKLAQDYAKNNPPADCFGAKDWKYFGAEQTVAHPVPLKMIQDFDSSKWMLTWVPETINGKELTLSSIDQFVSDFKNGKDAFKSTYQFPLSNRVIHDKTVKPFKAHWVMLSRDVLDGTRNQNFATQEKLVSGAGFEIPNLIDALVSVLLHNLKTADFIYPDGQSGHRRTYTRVQEQSEVGYQILVGGFSALGLAVYYPDYSDYVSIGASCARKSIGI